MATSYHLHPSSLTLNSHLCSTDADSIAWNAPYYGGPGWWRPIDMATSDGMFTLRTDTFKSYHASFGFVK